MDGWDWLLWASLAVSGLQAVLMIWQVRTRPGAPPGSWLVRGSVLGVIAATAGLIWLGWWLGTRQG